MASAARDVVKGGRPLGQLPLALRLDGAARFETFVSERNAAAVAHVQAVARGERPDTLWLWGGPGQGKSHLLQAACRIAGASGRRAMYLPLTEAYRAGADSLTGLDDVDLLALDQVDTAAGLGDWEQRLFSVLDGCLVRGAGLLLGARRSPAACRFVLPDLASRAAGAIVYRLQALSEDGRLEALMVQARCRGLELDRAAAAYLLTRVERDMGEICRWLDRLDRAALAAQRRVTIPFIRSTLAAQHAAD